ncbi:MAG: AAA family ATPase [Snowella sp.]|nr:AAA family ATPase [Snowella sp.]
MTEQSLDQDQGITEITVQGFKSLYEESRIEIRPLTVLAGANSSGKSSMMQPLLLMKQTLEVLYDPGALLINGPNVKFTSGSQLLSNTFSSNDQFSVAIKTDKYSSIKIIFQRENLGINSFRVSQFTENLDKDNEIVYCQEMSSGELSNLVFRKELSDRIYKQTQAIFIKESRSIFEEAKDWVQEIIENAKKRWLFKVASNRCFFQLNAINNYPDQIDSPQNSTPLYLSMQNHLFAYLNDISNIAFSDQYFGPYLSFRFTRLSAPYLKIIHLPGLRGTPERTYPITGVKNQFPGTFDNYFASIIYHWQATQNSKIEELNKYLQDLGLTSKVTASRPNDVNIELQVGLSKDISDTVVNIADVGLGVSQVLPVLVALLVAEPGQLVYLEQPELHLHPRAQANLAQPLIDAANRGVKVVVETHSDLLLTRIKTLVAEEAIDPAKLILHWFSRGDDGITKINSKELDKVGAYGEFPIDFSDVFFEEDRRYIDAASKQLLAKNRK